MRTILLSCFLLSTAFGQSTPPKDTPGAAAESPALRAARHSFMLISTRAIALFRSADTIEARLEAEGSTLHPATTTLRLRIEHTLDRIDADLNKGDVSRANEHIKLVEELVNRFERRLGGE